MTLVEQTSGERLSYTLRSTTVADYEVRLDDSLRRTGYRALAERLGTRRALLVTTPTVARLYADDLRQDLRDAGVELPVVALDCAEDSKNLAHVEDVCRAAYDHRLDRTSVLVALGGGVCSDIVTVAASLIRRGIATIRVPTTLIGQIDAGIGLKGGLNFDGRKSALGCFHAPETVFVDPSFLATVPRRHLGAGLAEIVKIAIVRDETLFGLLVDHGRQLLDDGFQGGNPAGTDVLWRAIEGMLAELEANPFENHSYERLVDFGHVFSSVLESRHRYRLPHGEAVAVDMALTCALGHELGITPADVRDRVIALLAAFDLPVDSPELDRQCCEQALADSVAHRGGSLNLVVPDSIGHARFVRDAGDVDGGHVAGALAHLAGRANRATVERRPVGVCFDIGGTTLRAATFEIGGTDLIDTYACPTPSIATLPASSSREIYDAVLARVVEVGGRLLGGRLPTVVSLAFPGLVTDDGRVWAAPTVWGGDVPDPIDLAADLGEKWAGARIFVANDVTAAGYRYLRGPDDDLCVVTVSSGIGNKIFVDGRPLLGPERRGGEIGHHQVDWAPDAPRCDCGERGHLGAISSGRGALRLATAVAQDDPGAFRSSRAGELCLGAVGRLDNEVLAAAYRDEDPWTRAIVRRSAGPLGRALAGIHLAAGVERFVVIGGFALAMGESYRRDLAEAATVAGWRTGQTWDSMIELGVADDLSGLLGAAAHARRGHADHRHRTAGAVTTW